MMGHEPMVVAYIAGPFRGKTPLDVERNIERARDLALLVAACGLYPCTPHLNSAPFDKQLTDEFWLNGSLELLQRCDCIVLTPDYQRSAGALAEYAWAQRVQMPIHEYTGDNNALDEFAKYVLNRQHDAFDYLHWPRIPQ